MNAPEGNVGRARAVSPPPSCPPSGVAVIVGGADCVWDDLDRALGIAPDPTIIAVNDAIAHCARNIHHGVTLHPEKLVGEPHPRYNPDAISWRDIRAANGYNTDYETWSRRNAEWVDHRLNHWGAGSSGLYGVTVAYHLGAEKVILCGIPMTDTPHFEGATGVEGLDGTWDECDIHRPGWEKNMRRLKGRVRSMSGWTRRVLGEPTADWIQG